MKIEGVLIKPVNTHTDDRGWLAELFRKDELPANFEPAMAYISSTKPGISRGPHEHCDQTDCFIFLDGQYELYLWENRDGKPLEKTVVEVGEKNPCAVIVPPGVVHGYKNVGPKEATVINMPDRLYAGWGKKEPVDEIRHEENSDSRFKI